LPPARLTLCKQVPPTAKGQLHG